MVQVLEFSRADCVWVNAELSCHHKPVSSSDRPYIILYNTLEYSDLLAGAPRQLLDKSDILGENLLSGRSKVTGKQMLHKVVVGRPWNIPHQLDTRVPGSVHLACHVTRQVPEHCSIEVSRVSGYCIKNLGR